MLVNPTQVCQYQNSDSAMKAIRHFKHFGDGNEYELSQHECCDEEPSFCMYTL